MLDIVENKINISPKVFHLQTTKISKYIENFSSAYRNIIYFGNPSSYFEVLAVGKLLSFDSNYSNLGKLYSQITNKFNTININIENKNLPLFFGYCKFPSITKDNLWKDFYDSEWILPEYLFYRGKDGTIMINFSPSFDSSIKLNFLLDDYQSTNNKKNIKLNQLESDFIVEWEKKVNSAIKLIYTNKVSKIVLSRKKEFKVNNQINFTEIIDALNNDYQDCFNFLIKSNDSYFFGSSPELLTEIDNTNFKSEALAGSIERGNSALEDGNLSNFLLNDNKNLHEHQIVIDYLKSNLEEMMCDFEISDKPKIKRLKNIQHLQTEIKGKIKSDKDIFNIVSKIFPTPAVCGIPKEIALNELSKLENFERGLFTGFVGWFNLNNKADFYVAIRSGLFRENFLSVFAGCGIVKDSNALDEYKETELKSKVITDLFDVES